MPWDHNSLVTTMCKCSHTIIELLPVYISDYIWHADQPKSKNNTYWTNYQNMEHTLVNQIEG